MKKRMEGPLIAIAALLLTGGFQQAPKRTRAQPRVEFHSEDDQIDKTLDRGRDGGLANTKGELISETPITLDGHPGREFVIRTPTAIIRARAYMVGNRCYQIIFTTPLNIQDKKNECEMFFESFKLINRQKA